MAKRAPGELRRWGITPHFLQHPEGSALVVAGDTQVVCTASIEDRVPTWLQGKGRGWITAEYDMLPRATHHRRERDSHRGRVQGRTQEISRLIGRALRAAVDLSELGERTITIDCDVLQADGGTRTAAITGASVALYQALAGLGGGHPVGFLQHIAAVSVGLLDDKPQLDLDYGMDNRADVDMNVVMTAHGGLIEVQGTAERAAFSREQHDALLDLALSALPALRQLQARAADTPRTSASMLWA